jgi:peptidyl-prolyl cis-trans isomerase C
LGGEEALADWMATYGFTSESFSRALARSISAVWMRDQIVAAVPKSAEQVHARQILLYNSEQASEVYAQLEAGNDFGNLALQYDPLTGGDLGWIPRGYLPNTDLEEAAFVLEPEQFSPVIKTLAGFHILQVIGRDPQRPLPPEAFVIAQTRALQEWLEARRDRADIQLMLP